MKAPGWLRVTTAPGASGLVMETTIRWWHPGAWWALALACLRLMHLLPRHCGRCRGAGRLGVWRTYLRRRRCPVCHGRGIEVTA